MDPRIAPLLGDLLTACQKRTLTQTDWEMITLARGPAVHVPLSVRIFMVRHYFIRNGCSGHRANLIGRQIESSWAALRLYDEERSKGVRS
jgi:hypothetical protein